MAECLTEIVPDTENIPHSPESSIQRVDIINDIPENHQRGRQEYRTEYADIACRLTAAYFTEQDVAYALGVSYNMLQSWKRRFPGFKSACEDGRKEAKKRVVAQLMKQALGYKTIEHNVKTIKDSNGTVLKTEVSEFHKDLPGNERLLVFLLMNLDRQLKDKEWENVNKVEVDESRSVKIVVDGKSAKEQIAKLAGELSEQP